MSVDLRTRCGGEPTRVSTAEFFDAELPAALEAHAALTGPGAAGLGIESFSIETRHGAWTLERDGRRSSLASRHRSGPTRCAGRHALRHKSATSHLENPPRTTTLSRR